MSVLSNLVDSMLKNQQKKPQWKVGLVALKSCKTSRNVILIRGNTYQGKTTGLTPTSSKSVHWFKKCVNCWNTYRTLISKIPKNFGTGIPC